jgi:glycosyltransferase involved in cell wall biosynthesis
MRIVQFMWKMSLADGGVVRAVLDLCPLLSAPETAGAGQDVELITCIDDDVPESWKRSAGAGGLPRVVKVDKSTSGTTMPSSALAKIEERVASADVVHLHGMWVRCNTQVAKICQRLNKPYVWSPHGMLDDWCMAQKSLKKRAFMMLVGKGLLERAAYVHCTAEAELEQARKWFPRGRGGVVALPFDVSPFDPGPGRALAEQAFAIDRSLGPVVLYLGRLHHKKGAHALIRAISEMKTGGRACQLLLAGSVGTGDEAYQRELDQLAQADGAKGRVRFLGLVGGEKKASLYQAADVFCLPSSQENFGYVVVEAMSAGIPVVTTKQVALWPAIEREHAGVICKDNAQSHVVEALERVLAMTPQERAEAGARGRAWAAREFDSSRIAQSFKRMYEEAAGKGSRT